MLRGSQGSFQSRRWKGGKLESVSIAGTQLNLFQVGAASGKKHTLDFLLNELTTQDSAGTIKALPKQLLLGNSHGE